MDWNRRLRIRRTPVVGALVAAGLAGAALLAGPMASSQAADAYTYPNGGFCYQNSLGQANDYRQYFSEPSYDPDSLNVYFLFVAQQWDDSSNQYKNQGRPVTIALSKSRLKPGTVFHDDANEFCKSITGDPNVSPYMEGRLYSYGEYTSMKTVDPTP